MRRRLVAAVLVALGLAGVAAALDWTYAPTSAKASTPQVTYYDTLQQTQTVPYAPGVTYYDT